MRSTQALGVSFVRSRADSTLAYTNFFGIYDHAFLAPSPPGTPASLAHYYLLCGA